MNYYSKHIGDYATATAHLSLAEHGAYNLMIDAACGTERPLPDDINTLCRMLRAVTDQERQAVENVASEFFVRTESGLINRRVEVEIRKFREFSEAQSRRGKSGGRPRKEETREKPGEKPALSPGFQKQNPDESRTKPGGNPEETPEKASHSPSPIPHSPLPSTRSPDPEQGFLAPPPPPSSGNTQDGAPSARAAAAAGKKQSQPAAQAPQEIAEALDDAGISNAKKRAQIAATPCVTAALIRKFAEDGRNRGKGPGAIAENILAAANKAATQGERTAKAKATLAQTEAKQRAKAEADAAEAKRKDEAFDAAFNALEADELKHLWKVVSDGEDPRWKVYKRKKFDAKNSFHRTAVMTLKREVEATEGGAA